MEMTCLSYLFNVVFNIITRIEYHSKITNSHPQHKQILIKDWADNVNWVEAARFFSHLAEDH